MMVIMLNLNFRFMPEQANNGSKKQTKKKIIVRRFIHHLTRILFEIRNISYVRLSRKFISRV